MPLRMRCVISSQSNKLISDFLKSCPAQEKSSLTIAMPEVATYSLISHLKITMVYCTALFTLFPPIASSMSRTTLSGILTGGTIYSIHSSQVAPTAWWYVISIVVLLLCLLTCNLDKLVRKSLPESLLVCCAEPDIKGLVWWRSVHSRCGQHWCLESGLPAKYGLHDADDGLGKYLSFTSCLHWFKLKPVYCWPHHRCTAPKCLGSKQCHQCQNEGSLHGPIKVKMLLWMCIFV